MSVETSCPRKLIAVPGRCRQPAPLGDDPGHRVDGLATGSQPDDPPAVGFGDRVPRGGSDLPRSSEQHPQRDPTAAISRKMTTSTTKSATGKTRKTAEQDHDEDPASTAAGPSSPSADPTSTTSTASHQSPFESYAGCSSGTAQSGAGADSLSFRAPALEARRTGGSTRLTVQTRPSGPVTVRDRARIPAIQRHGSGAQIASWPEGCRSGRTGWS